MIHPKVRKAMQDVLDNDSALSDTMQQLDDLFEEFGLKDLVPMPTKEGVREQFKEMLEKDQIYGMEDE